MLLRECLRRKKIKANFVKATTSSVQNVSSGPLERFCLEDFVSAALEFLLLNAVQWIGAGAHPAVGLRCAATTSACSLSNRVCSSLC